MNYLYCKGNKKVYIIIKTSKI